MALKKNFEHNGVKVDGGYIKVSSIAGDKNSISITLSYAVDSAHGALKTERLGFVPSMDGGNFIAQAYAHLKTLPEFAGAVDC